MSKRKNHSPSFKAKVCLEALKGAQSVAELSSRLGVHPTMIHQWKGAFLEGASGIFERGAKKAGPRKRGQPLMKRKSRNCTPRSGSWLSPMIF